MPESLQTFAEDFTKLLDTNATNASFSSKVPTTTKPSGDGVLEVEKNNNLLVVLFGTDAANETFDARIIAWSKVATLWVPTPVVTVSCTLSTVTGVSGATVTNSNFFVDTISLSSGDSDTKLVSPANNTIGYVLLDVVGAELAEIQFDMTGAASANALTRRI